MQCKHPYFRMVKGQLVCTQCGKTPEEIRGQADKAEDKLPDPPEDKADGEHEDKAHEGGLIPDTSSAIVGEPKTWPPEAKRQEKVIKKGAKRGSRSRRASKA